MLPYTYNLSLSSPEQVSCFKKMFTHCAPPDVIPREGYSVAEDVQPQSNHTKSSDELEMRKILF